MNYGEIKRVDIANGRGVRVSLFVSGCRHHCQGCFNPETWDFSYGREFTQKTEDELIRALSPDFIAGLSLLGGEPFEEENASVLVPFVRRVRELFPRKDVWAYSGFTFEELTGKLPSRAGKSARELLSLVDTLVDGRFVEAKKDISLRFRGSSNQRILDVQASLAADRAAERKE